MWKLFTEIGSQQSLLEIQGLVSNALRTSIKLVALSSDDKLAENLLWTGQVDATITLFTDLSKKQAKDFCTYLNKHRSRIINYAYYQAEQLCSIGSGAVESAIKQIGTRLKLSSAQWSSQNMS